MKLRSVLSGLALATALAVTSGCPVPQSQDTPVPALRQQAGKYWLYVPSNYTDKRTWPLVVTLHGTHGWDSSSAQIREWKALAEEKGFIVAAPDLRSVQGIFPVSHKLWKRDLEQDEQAIVAITQELKGKYNIHSKAVMITGFSAGGYPLYYAGLRHPELFSMLIARSCNTDVSILEQVPLTDGARAMPVVIFWGKDDPGLQSQNWDSVAFFANHDFTRLKHHKFRGGHLRRPDLAYKYWMPFMPKECRDE